MGMLTGLHLLLTYKCTFECDHCFTATAKEKHQGDEDSEQ